MTYKENMKWLLGSATTRAAEEKKNNTDTAKWMAERSVAEGKLIQKLSVTGAKLIAKGHKQWREGQQAQATEDEYMRSVGWDPNSEEAKVLKDTEDGAIIQNIKNNDAGVEARKSGVDGNLVNMYTGKSPAYLAQVAKIRLSNISGGYEGWLNNQLIHNDTTLTIPATATSPAVEFKINETSGLPNPTARSLAHKFLRQKFFQENGLGNFSGEFLNHSGFFKSIVATDAKLGSKWRTESDIAHSAQQRHLAAKAMGDEFTAENVSSYIATAANGIDDEAKFIGYNKAWDMFEEWIVDSSQTYELSEADIARIANSKVPNDPPTKEYPEGRTFIQKWPSRFGPEGTIAQKLHKARKTSSDKEDEAKILDKEDDNEKAIEILGKIPEGAEDTLYEQYQKQVGVLVKKYGADGAKEVIEYYENRTGSTKTTAIEITEIRKLNKDKKVIDWDSYGYATLNNEEVKQIRKEYEEYRSNPKYKAQFKELQAHFGYGTKDGIWGTERRGGATLNGEAQDMYNLLLETEFRDHPKKFQAAASAVEMHFKENGYENEELNKAPKIKDKGRYYYDTNNNNFPNLVTESDGLATDLKKSRKLETNRETMLQQIKIIGNGSVEATLKSPFFAAEKGSEKLAHDAEIPDKLLPIWDVNQYLADHGDYPEHIYRVYNALDGAVPLYDIANFRQEARGFDPIDPKYESPQSPHIKQAGISTELQGKVMSGAASTSEILTFMNDIRNNMMEQDNLTADQANSIILMDMFGPVGEGFEAAHYENPDDYTASLLGMSWAVSMTEMSPSALDDLTEGAQFDITKAFKQQLDLGLDPYSLLRGGSNLQKQMFAQLTGDLTVLLRENTYRSLKERYVPTTE